MGAAGRPRKSPADVCDALFRLRARPLRVIATGVVDATPWRRD